MAFFQNVFDQEFQGYLAATGVGGMKFSPTFRIDPNVNMQSQQVAWNKGPYDFSTSGILIFNFAWDVNFKQWASVSIDVSGTTAASTSASEVISALNSDPIFSSVLIAKIIELDGGQSVSISKKTAKNLKFYFSNSGAETKLKFNKKAGVAELPNYFERHTVKNTNNYEDSAGMLIKLDKDDEIDQKIIQTAGLNPFDIKEDWELLRGRSNLFKFKKITVDGNDRTTEIIEYPAGAIAGDFAKKINYSYNGSDKNPNKVTEIPYVLKTEDLITP